MPPDRSTSLAVLTYHRIGAFGAGPPGIISATPRRFARQMSWVASTGRAISLHDLLAIRDGAPAPPGGAILVTFDDATIDFAAHAWPVLRRLGIPVTLFVATLFAQPGAPGFWWERLHAAVRGARGVVDMPAGPTSLKTPVQRRRAYRALREHVKSLPHDEAMAFVDTIVERLGGPLPGPPSGVLGWPELRKLAAEGVTLAPHSRSHPLLNRLPVERLAQEIVGSIEDLRRETGQATPAFAYPGGGVPAQADHVLREAGIRIAFTTQDGVEDCGHVDWLRVRRINVGRRMIIPLLRRAAARRPPAALGGARVAYVMSRFPKISETFVLAEILAMERRGLQVDVYPLMREREELAHPEALEIVRRARYTPFASPAILASQAHWLRRHPRAYLGALRDCLRGTWGSVNFFVGALGIFPKVAHVARRMQADGVTHVHCHFANHPALAGFIIHRLTAIPYSFTAHGSDLHVERRMLGQKVAEAAFVATISHDNRRLILSECGAGVADKVHVVRAGIDTTLFAPDPDAAPRNGGRPLAVLCVGTLHEVKGQAHLIEACRLLAQRGIAVACRLIGGGPDQQALSEAIAAAGLADRVTLVGARTRQQIADELRATDVLVAPSVPTREGKREGIPVVLMEAMSTGLAVVASELSGIPELVQDGVSGLLVAPGDAPELADALARLHADPDLRRRLGAAGREQVLREFDVEASAGELARRFGVVAA